MNGPTSGTGLRHAVQKMKWNLEEQERRQGIALRLHWLEAKFFWLKLGMMSVIAFLVYAFRFSDWQWNGALWFIVAGSVFWIIIELAAYHDSGSKGLLVSWYTTYDEIYRIRRWIEDHIPAFNE